MDKGLNEKHSADANPFPRLVKARRRSRTSWRHLMTSLAGASLLIYWLSLHGSSTWLSRGSSGSSVRPLEPAQDGKHYTRSKTEPWEEITPSKRIEWHSCYEAFQCALLTVPLDYESYSTPSATFRGAEVHIALLLLPAKNTTNTTHGHGPNRELPSKRSPMLINPGGPGGSGTRLALSTGPSMQYIFGDDQPVLGFDPRGVGYTTPRADCFSVPIEGLNGEEDIMKGYFHRVEWENQKTFIGLANSSSSATKYLNAGFRTTNDLCRQKHEELGPGSILAHASTPHVARDMISIIDAWDEWQDSLQESSAREKRPLGEADEKDPASTKGKLVYWGFSYGTYLGHVFASMFPDRVGRVILDGVVDADRYVDPIWMDSLRDTDKILDLFFEYCVSKRSDCKFFHEGDRFIDVANRYAAVLSKLQDQPVTIINHERHAPFVFSASLFKQVVFSVLYNPSGAFDLLASLLEYLHTNDLNELNKLFRSPDLADFCVVPGLFPTGYLPGDAQKAIMCGDKTNLVNLSLAEIETLFDKLAATSSFADVWIQLLLVCNGWDVHAGAHSSEPPAHRNLHHGAQINTSYPILLLSNTLDPVTPLIAGVKMALKFKDAGLIEQQSAGHCTSSSYSPCTYQVVQDYVLHGKVPAPPIVEGDDYLGGEWKTCAVPSSLGGVQNLRDFEAMAGRLGAIDQKWVKQQRQLEAFQTIRDAVLHSQLWGKRTMVDWSPFSDEPFGQAFVNQPGWV